MSQSKTNFETISDLEKFIEKSVEDEIQRRKQEEKRREQERKRKEFERYQKERGYA